MRHMPFFRWVLTLGFVLFACAVGLYAAAPDLPEARQIDLTVLDEEPDGSCTVRWSDPYQKREREASYQCDPGRSDLLKASQSSGSGGYGWESGFMFTEGPDRGDLEDLSAGQDLERPDVFLLLGTSLIAVGLIGGNLRALPRVLGVQARLVRRATELSEAAMSTVEDYERAVAAVEEAGRQDALPNGADNTRDSNWSRRSGCCGRRARRRGRRRPSPGNSQAGFTACWTTRPPPPGCGACCRPAQQPGLLLPERLPTCACYWTTLSGTVCASVSHRPPLTCFGARTPTGPPSRPRATSQGTPPRTDTCWPS
ncbi:hypothetical protein STENM327S_07787 [Streptomyces tendae]